MLAPGKVTAREPLMEVFRSPLRFLLPLGGVALPAAARASSFEDSFAQKGNPSPATGSRRKSASTT